MSAPISSSLPPTEPISYTIAGCSEHSGHYVADNIKVDRPHDPSSRWSGAQQPPSMKQWILLRLDSLAVVKSITFGKVPEHPCNMKEFKLYVGLHPDHMIQVLRTSLKDDVAPETFAIPQANRAGVSFPTRFIKILPLSAHVQSFHISIWHVLVAGITEPSYVEPLRARYDEYREAVVLRHVLKHLRERRLLTPYMSILARTSLDLEHPLVTALYTALVLQGDFSSAESILPQMSSAHLFDSYIRSCQPHACWVRLYGADANGDAPDPRGGHAMALDTSRGIVYLLGGWDGRKSLDDLWAYNIGTERWEMLCRSTTKEKNGPGPRACHKMVCDSKAGCLYVLGRLGDDVGSVPAPPDGGIEQQSTQTGDGNGAQSFCSEFYRYHTRGLDAGKWDLLSFDTASSGGPELIFDHQMVMDSDAQMIYVSGGRIVHGDWSSPRYSGLYSYNIRTSKWKLLQPVNTSSFQSPIPPRYGHSMVLDSLTHTFFIFAGQRDNRYLSDMYAYDLEKNTVTELFANFSTVGGPDACFTQRAVIDPKLKEIYVFCGLTRRQQTEPLTVLRADAPNWVYRYTCPHIPGTWTQILPERVHEKFSVTNSLHSNSSERAGRWKEYVHEGDIGDEDVPRPRYAHQVVYDEKTGRVFLHGGNAGEQNDEDDGGGGIADGRQGGGMDGHAGGDSREAEGTGTEDGAHGSGQHWRWLRYDNDSARDGDRDRDGDREEDGNRQHRPQTRARELRLDDFWSMTLVRAGPEEVVRRGIYQIRQQRFREMCEDLPPLTALHYLQRDVADVVDHTNSEEADAFRSLLAHLLAITPSKLRSPSVDRGGAGSPDQGYEYISEWDRETYREDKRDNYPSLDDVPPKKRTRSSSPSEEEGVWTNTIEGESVTEEHGAGGEAEGQDTCPSSGSSRRPCTEPELVSRSTAMPMTRSGAQKRSHAVLVLDEEDPLEGSSAAGNGNAMKAKMRPLSADRFRQRTEVFEGLLAFIEVGAKQPEGSLLDLVDAEDGL
ncbi:Muskelin N-terminus-domain-containing protein [Scleroderma yunnanense]